MVEALSGLLDQDVPAAGLASLTHRPITRILTMMALVPIEGLEAVCLMAHMVLPAAGRPTIIRISHSALLLVRRYLGCAQIREER